LKHKYMKRCTFKSGFNMWSCIYERRLKMEVGTDPTTEPGTPAPDTDPPEEGEKYDGGEIPAAPSAPPSEEEGDGV
jgi:hypothetical protein